MNESSLWAEKLNINLTIYSEKRKKNKWSMPKSVAKGFSQKHCKVIPTSIIFQRRKAFLHTTWKSYFLFCFMIYCFSSLWIQILTRRNRTRTKNLLYYISITFWNDLLLGVSRFCSGLFGKVNKFYVCAGRGKC